MNAHPGRAQSRPPSCRLLRDRSGVAALEFGLIAPVMVILFFGCVELANVFRMQARLNVVAGQLVEMIAGQQAVTLGTQPTQAGSLPDMCAGAALNLLPYAGGTLQASIGSVTVGYSLGYIHPITDWTTDTACGSTSYHAGQTALYTIANAPFSFFTKDGTPYNFGGGGGVPVTGYSAISVQLTYQYTNVAPFFLGNVMTFKATAAARPRSNTTIACTYLASGTATTCPQNP